MTETTVVTVGADMFADSVAGQAVGVERVDWRPPMPGTERDLAAVATDPRRPEANRTAVEAMRSASALRAIRLSIPLTAIWACSSACARSTFLASRMPWLAAQTRATPIGSSAAVRISRNLAAVGSAAKRRAASLNMDEILPTA